MTISNGTVTGYIAQSDEGQVDPFSKCTISKDRSTFSITVQGNALTLTVTPDLEYTGTSCPQTSAGTPGTLTGTRTTPAADSNTQLNGSWTLTNPDKSTFAAFSVDGLSAKAWSTPVDLSSAPVLTVAIANGIAVVSTTERDLTFAAQKR